MALPDQWRDRLGLPLIVAPMTGVSTVDLVVSACSAGAIGAFPVHLANTIPALHDILDKLSEKTSPDTADVAVGPYAPNIVVHRSNRRLSEELDCLVAHQVEVVIASVGAPDAIVTPLHESGTLVLADVASMRHAERAVAAGVDGLVLLTAGAGGQTGWANPFAFVRAVREIYDGIVVLAGGISDGFALHAAIDLGADLAYMGTRFIATSESGASDEYRQATVDSNMDDIVLSDRVGGIPASLIAAWLERNQNDPGRAGGFDHDRLTANRSAWSAGHGVGQVVSNLTVADVVERTRHEFDEAQRRAQKTEMRSNAR